MKKILGPVAIALLALCVSSCDFFRALAGRPTSAQLSKDTTCACCALPDTLVCADTTSCCAVEDSALAVKDICCTAGDSIILAAKDSCCAVEDSTLAVKDSCFKAEEPSCCEPEDIAPAAADEPEPAAKPAAKPIPAKPEVKPEAIEEAIISNIGQKTGFLKVSVSYNDVKLLNTVESGYYILIGTFKQKSNADRLAKQAEKAGQKVTRLEYANGRTSIALRRSDNLSDAFVALGEVRKLSFSPKDACIIVVE